MKKGQVKQVELGKKKAKKDIRTETEANKIIQITRQKHTMLFQNFSVTKANTKDASRLISVKFFHLEGRVT